MDSLIAGILAMAAFVAFTAGRAQSIGAIPFVLIVAIVISMAGFGFWQSARQGLRDEQEQKAGKK